MSKRSATELLTPAATAGQPFAKASGSGSKRDNAAPDEMGEFEDAWEDEIESDEEVIDAQTTEDADGLYGLRRIAQKLISLQRYGCRRRGYARNRRIG
jgi:hypothetical protein